MEKYSVSTDTVAIACIFRLTEEDLRDVETHQVAEYCFVARATNASDSCSSEPWCMWLVKPQFQQEEIQSIDLLAYAGISEPPGPETIHLSWTWQTGVQIPKGFKRFEFQYASGGQTYWRDVPASWPTSALISSVQFPAHDVAESGSNVQEGAQSILFFRVIVVTETRRHVSLRTNQIRLFHRDELPGRLHLVTWQSQVLRIYRSLSDGDRSTVQAVFEIPSHPILSGTFAVDSVRNRFFAITAKPSDEPDPSPTLVVANLQDHASHSLLALGGIGRSFYNTSFWNLQACEADGNLLVTTVNASGFAIATLDAISGHVIASHALAFPVRQAVSAVDSQRCLYWFIDASSNTIKSYDWARGTFSGGIELCAIAQSACTTGQPVILHLAFDSNRRQLHIVAGPWQSGDDSSLLTLVAFDPYGSAPVAKVALSAVKSPGSGFVSYAFDFARSLLFVSTATDSETHIDARMITYDMRSNFSSFTVLSHVGRVVGLAVNADSTPVVQTLSPALLQPGLQSHMDARVTITGLNFALTGHLVAKLDGMPCTTVRLSASRLYCTVPPTIDVNAGHVFSVSVDIGGLTSREVGQAGQFQFDAWKTASPASFFTLMPGAIITVSGSGFFEPFTRYRCAFGAPEFHVLSGPPIMSSHSSLEFNVPVWHYSTKSDMELSLLHASSDVGANTILDRAVHHDSILPLRVNLSEMFGHYAPAGALSDGSSEALRILGLGFDPDGYQCMFSSDDPAQHFVRVLASVRSNHEIICTIPKWPYSHGVTRLYLRKKGLPVQYFIQGMPMPSESANFTFKHHWISAQPLSGLITGDTQITIVGYGFDANEAYQCRLTGLGPPYLSADLPTQQRVGGAPGHLKCKTTATTGTAVGLHARVSLLDGSGLPVPLQGISPVFEFQPQWLSISVSVGAAAGGTLVTVRGAGLSNETNFRCMFSDSSLHATADAIFLNSSNIMCISPTWPGPATQAILSIVMTTLSGSPMAEFKLGGTNLPAVFPFEMTQEIVGISPNEVFAHLTTVFRVSGTGFDPTSTSYECVLGFSNATQYVMKRVPAHAPTTNELECAPLKWDAWVSLPYALPPGSTFIKVAGNGITSEPLAVTFKQAVTSIATQEILASGGGVLTIGGAGFTVGGAYECEFQLNGTTIFTVSASPPSPIVFKCIMGPVNSSAGEVEVLVREKNEGLAPSLEDKLLDIFVPNRTFSLLTTVEDMSIFSGTAAGGDVITVRGFGFMQTNQYVMSFYHSAGESQSVECIFVNPQRILCETSTWNFAARTVRTSFSASLGFLIDRDFKFTFRPAVVTLASSSKSSAGVPSIVLVQGHGFSPGSAYQCIFFVDPPCGDSTCASDSAMLRQYASHVAHRTGEAINASIIKCITPSWQFPASNVSLNVTLAGDRIPGDPLPFRFLAEMFSMNPSHGILQGTSITIKGAGLKDYSNYSCSMKDKDFVQYAPARVTLLNFTRLMPGKYFNFELVCEIPPIRSCDAFLIEVRVVDLGSGEVIKGLFDFEYTEGLLSVAPSAGPATGNLKVTLVGCGFHKNGQYAASFRDTASPSHFRLSGNASFINSSAVEVIFPYWPFGSALAAVGLKIDENVEDTSANVAFNIFPVATSYLPRSGSVFGSYLLVQGHGFTDSDGFHVCLLQSQTNSSEMLEVDAFARGGATELECEISRWPFATSFVNVTLLYGKHREVIPQLEGLQITYHLVSAWLVADLAPISIFSGGTPITIRGGGFNPDGGPIYTCHFTVANQGSCPVKSISQENGFGILDSDCTQAHSSDPSLPLHLRGPYVATSKEFVVCWTPAWLRSAETTVALKLYEGSRLVEKFYVPKLVTTTFVGGPVVGAGSTTNAHAEGNAMIIISGDNYGFADMSPRARLGQTACSFTEWHSNTQVSCRAPTGIVGATVDLLITIGPYRLGTLSDFFTFDGPTIRRVDNPLSSQVTARVRSTASESSSWQSDSKILSKTAEVALAPNSTS